MLIHGEELQAMIPKDSAQIYHFDNEQGLTQDEVRRGEWCWSHSRFGVVTSVVKCAFCN